MSVTSIVVRVPDADYEVRVGPGLLEGIGDAVKAVSDARRIALVTDETVARLHGVRVDTTLARAGFEVLSFMVPPGESSKSWHRAGELLEAFAAKGLSRTDLVLAVGGGVVGDLAGFTAAVYQRGIDYVQVPTTLLAMVDSSVGGKTAVDLSAGKNLAGAFKQPRAVLADTSVLSTLPEAEWSSGLAEVAKSAVIDGEEFLAWLEDGAEGLMRREPVLVTEAVTRSVGFKAGVVARDEREEGPRECLNYGHTLGHAIEKLLGYGSISHGAAVAEGMRFAARVSVQLAGAQASFVKRQDRLLDALGLPSADITASGYAVLEAMRGDKKSRGGRVRMVLVEKPGSWVCVPVDDDVVAAHLDQWTASKTGGARHEEDPRVERPESEPAGDA